MVLSWNPLWYLDVLFCPTVGEHYFPRGGEYVAVVSECNGGATTSFSTRVSVFNRYERGADRRHNMVFGRETLAESVSVRWTGPRELVIATGNSLPPPYRQVAEWNGVHVIYDIPPAIPRAPAQPTPRLPRLPTPRTDANLVQ